VGPGECAPRVVYGRYLQAVYHSIIEDLPSNVTVKAIQSRVLSIDREGDSYRLTFADGRESASVQKITLATGHPKNNVTRSQQPYVHFADHRPGLTFIPGDSAADLPLDQILDTDTVGIMGMGLGFFDVLLSLTVGRGGRFEVVDDQLRYLASGREPRIVAGSRGGAPIFARGRNHKTAGMKQRSLFLTTQAIQDARARTLALEGTERLDFNRDIYPLLQAEMDHVYYKTHVRLRHGAEIAERFANDHIAFVHRGDCRAEGLLQAYDLVDIPRLDLFALARPFASQQFPDRASFREALCELLRADLVEARRGNIDGPLKAALDVLRDVRDHIRVAVDFGGLRPESYREDFLGAFVPVCSILSAGPPALRLEQTLALMQADVLEVIGPDTDFSCDDREGRFRMASPRVQGAIEHVTVLIDSRIPMTELQIDRSELTQALLADGSISSYVVREGFDEALDTGGLAVTHSPFHILDAAGKPNPDIYALGIPTEHTRWFTQVGSDTPNALTRFSRDAEAIAFHIQQSLWAMNTATTNKRFDPMFTAAQLAE